MSISFGEERWKDIILNRDFESHMYPDEETIEETLFTEPYRFVTYDLRDSVTHEAYEGLMDTLEEENESESTVFESGELFAKVILEATEDARDEWVREGFNQPDRGRDPEYELHGTPFLRILDDEEALGETEFATRPFNTVSHLQEKYSQDEYDTPREFLNGMDKVLFESAYGRRR